jgi:hypothetical protein
MPISFREAEEHNKHCSATIPAVHQIYKLLPNTHIKMAAGQKLYPRATVKKIVKAHSKRNVSKNVDVQIFLDYVLFLQTYAIPMMHDAS